MKPATHQTRRLRIAVDIGGTFTDGVALLAPEGRIWVGKTLTTPDDPGKAVSTVISDLFRQIESGHEQVIDRETDVVHGTTLVSNTLIERKGARTALLVTRGTADVLSIGREVRYDLYDLNLPISQPLVPRESRVEVAERLNARGEILERLTKREVDRVVDAIKQLDVEAVAICLLHSYVNDEHERMLAAEIQKEAPELTVCYSAEIAREIREFERSSTVAANAYVQPLVKDYLANLEARIGTLIPKARLRVMVSSGGFTSAGAAAVSPILLLESGPAGGVLSAINTARNAGISQILAFDMGGTTAKACVALENEPAISHSFECARISRFKKGSGLPILIPSIDLIEIGAGGGSIAHVNSLGLLNVGPDSSNSTPGPACYGLGGTQPTVTDADLVLGYLNPDRFLGGSMKLERAQAERALSRVAQRLKLRTIDVAWGVYDIVNENMASAARLHITEKGHDPRDFTLVATGGAGPVHAVEVARKLKIPHVLATIAAGAGSCLGLLSAPARVDRSWSNPTRLAEMDWLRVASEYEKLRADAMREIESAGVASSSLDWEIGAEVRYAGQGHAVAVTVPWREVDGSLAAQVLSGFELRYEQLYGHLVPAGIPEVVTWRLTGRSQIAGQRYAWGDARTDAKAAQRSERLVYLPLKREHRMIPVYDRYSLKAGTVLVGPLILEERESTLVVPVTATVTILADLTVSIKIEEFE